MKAQMFHKLEVTRQTFESWNIDNEYCEIAEIEKKVINDNEDIVMEEVEFKRSYFMKYKSEGK